MNRFVRWWYLCLLVTVFAVSGCATADDGGSGTTESAQTAVGEVDEAPGTVRYYLLVAEMALQKELYDVAIENYGKAAMASDDPEIAQRATELAFELDRDGPARTTAERWRSLSPDAPQPLVYLARLHVRANDARAASGVLRKMVELSEAEPEDRFLPLVYTLSREENTDTALEAMSRLVKRYRKSPYAHYALGIQALRSDDLVLARASAEKATKLAADWPLGHLLLARTMIAAGEVDRGIDYASEHVGGTNSVEERLEYGILLAGVDRDLEAVLVLEQVLQDDPGNASALRTLGLLELQAGNVDMAEQYFSVLLNTGRAPYDALYFLAGIAENKQQEQRAYRLYSEVKAGDNVVVSQLRAAGILHRSGKLDEALQHLERFSSQYPKYTLDMALGQGELLADGGREDEALMLYDSILSQDPDTMRAQYARAFLLEQVDRVDDAIHQMRLILAKDPTDATALNALGYTLADRTDQYQEAYELIALAYEKQPDSGPIIDSLGWVEFKRGNLEQAREHLEKAYSLIPDPEVAGHLLEVVHAQGDNERIESLLNELETSFPDDEEIQSIRNRLGL